MRADPVVDMRGHGSHNQPLGTWSDDSSLLLCSVDSLLAHEFDTEDMGKRFVAWSRGELWTPHGRVFDIGVTTSRALAKIAMGVRAEVAGSDRESSNGNGSLMRIIPVSLRFAHRPTGDLIRRIHLASALTHRHPRSQLACALFSLVIRELLKGKSPTQAFVRATGEFQSFHEPDPSWSAELDHFQPILTGDLARRPESQIESGGYVIHTLTASLWCLLTTRSYRECVLKAVNLGGDTDTTGCVAGGLAGVCHGFSDIPESWIRVLARQEEVGAHFSRFADLLEGST